VSAGTDPNQVLDTLWRAQQQGATRQQLIDQGRAALENLKRTGRTSKAP
jgi:hypothetical protein